LPIPAPDFFVLRQALGDLRVAISAVLYRALLSERYLLKIPSTRKSEEMSGGSIRLLMLELAAYKFVGHYVEHFRVLAPESKKTNPKIGLSA
jgi:hypothetical protein